MAAGLDKIRLVCAWCGAARPADLNPWCEVCGGSLVAEAVGAAGLPESWNSLSDLAALLPGGPNLISLGEGGTPLVRLARLYGDDKVYAKADWMNPTGSFKDRGAAVAMSAAIALGAEGVVCASTGNNATSVSAYAARAGLPCVVTLPSATPASKVAHACAYGATVVDVDGTFSDAYHAAEQIRMAAPRWANLTSTFVNPYMTAAHASIFYELIRQMGREPGTILIPSAPDRCRRHPSRRGASGENRLDRPSAGSGRSSVGRVRPHCAGVRAGQRVGPGMGGESVRHPGLDQRPATRIPRRRHPHIAGDPPHGRLGGGCDRRRNQERHERSRALRGDRGRAGRSRTAGSVTHACPPLCSASSYPLVISGHALKDPEALPSLSLRLSAADGLRPLDIVASAKAHFANAGPLV